MFKSNCKFLIILLYITLCLTSINFLNAQPIVLSTNWVIEAEETSFTSLPWLTTNDHGVRYCTYNPVTDHVLVISRTNVTGGLSGPNADIIILDAATGEMLGKLNFDPAIINGQDPYVLLNIKCASDGAIYAGNLVQTADSFPFRLYRWENETAEPTLAFESIMWSNRYGDALAVIGEGENTAVYVGGSQDQEWINILTTINGIDFDWTEALSIPPAYASLGIAPTSLNGNIWVNSGLITLYTPVSLLANDGSLIGSISYDSVNDSTSGIVYFEIENKKYIMVSNGEIIPQGGYLVDITGGPEAAQVIAVTPPMGTNPNEMGLGDVAFDSKRNAVIVLCPNNQIASFDLSSVISSNVKNAEAINEIPDKYQLAQNFPNPFNPRTTITFKLSQLSNIRLAIFDITGREVAALVDKELNAGSYQVSWEGMDNMGIKLSSGIYVYQLQAGNVIQSKKMIFVQ
jgi:hypothetical protein